MENSYGIGVANRYALFLDDESDPSETLSIKVQEIELKKKIKVAEKENKVKNDPVPKGKPTSVPKKSPKDANSKPLDNRRDESKISPRSNDGKQEKNYKSNENREERNNRRNREDRPFNGTSENRDREDRRDRREQTGDNFESRPRDRGDRRERDGPREGRDPRAIGNKPGGPRGPRRTFDDRRGKRDFDRQSGSDKTHGYRGVKPLDKREGAGAHNWGSHKDVIEDADRPISDADNNWGEENKPETTDVEKKEDDVATTPVEEEPQELTLDEYKAKCAGRIKPQYNIRKAGEGEDPSQWKKMYELRKKENEEETEEEEFDASEFPQRVGRQKHLEIDIQFNDKRRPGTGGVGRGRGRGGPGGPRGGGGRGGPRGGPGRDGEREKDGDKERDGGRGGRGTGRDRDGGDRRYRSDEQVEEKSVEARQAPKVDDEHDFPSLG